MPVVDLRELVAAKVHDELARMNGELERMVAEAVDRELDRLVAEELNGRANDADVAGGAWQATPPAGEPSKRCTRCGETKAADAFPPARRVCRACRSQQELARIRARRLVPSTEGTSEDAAAPFAGAASTSSPSATAEP